MPNVLLFCLGLVSVLGVLYFPYLTGQTCFYRLDASCFFEPLCTYLGDHIRRGQLPIWNPLVYCGMAQSAVSSPGIFYPPNLLFVLAPFSNALAMSQVFHQLAAGLGMYLLIAGAGWGVIPAVVAGASFALCGYMFSQYYNFTLMATASWLPFCFWGLQNIGAELDRKSFRAILIAAVCSFLLITAGRPEVWLPGLLTCVFYILCSAVVRRSDPAPNILKQVWWRLLSIAIGAALSMPSTLPIMEWSSLSPRGHGLQWIEVLGYSANWYDFLGFILNRPLGDVEAFGARFAPLVVNPLEQFPLASSVFLGPVILTLAIWALFESGWKLRWLYLAGLVFFSLLATGKNVGVAHWLIEHCQTFLPLRYPAKLLIFSLGILAILAARGAYTCFKSDRSTAGQIGAALVWLLVLFSSLVCADANRTLATIVLGSTAPNASALDGEAIVLLGRSGIEVSLIGLATCLLRALFTTGRIRKPVFATLIVVAPVTMLLAAGAGTLSHGTTPDFYRVSTKVRETVIGKFPADKPLQYRYMPFMYFPLMPPSAVPGADWTEKFYQYKRQILMPNQIIDAGVPCSVGYEAAWTSEHKQLMDAVGNRFVRVDPSTWDIGLLSKVGPDYLKGGARGPESFDRESHQLPLVRFCKLTATRYVLGPQVRMTNGSAYLLKLLDPDLFELIGEFPESNARLYAVKDALPRAYLAGNWSPLNSQEELLKLLLAEKHDDYDPAKTTYVDRVDSSYVSERLAGSSAGAVSSESKVEFVQSKSDDVSLSVKTSVPSLLVLADTFYPGWLATIDGSPTRICRANLIDRAVVVPAGSHTVRFTYTPFSLQAGLHIATLAMIVLFSLFLLSIARKRP